MASTLADALHLITAALSSGPRDHKEKTLARLRERLDRQGVIEIATRRGPLRFLSRRSVGAFKMAADWDDEPETLEWIDTWVNPGEVIYDVGAAIGVMAMYAALDPSVKVIAFEPKAASFALLCDHLHLNGMTDRVLPFCLALSDSAPRLASLRLHNPEAGGASNGLDGTPTQFGEIWDTMTQATPAISIDDFQRLFAAPAPDHIKLDVDGIEGVILRGAESSLRRVNSVIVEVEGDNLTDVAARIEAPLAAAGLEEDTSVREKGLKRNRLYVRR
jgi:FkbM family methyltransferase